MLCSPYTHIIFSCQQIVSIYCTTCSISKRPLCSNFFFWEFYKKRYYRRWFSLCTPMPPSISCPNTVNKCKHPSDPLFQNISDLVTCFQFGMKALLFLIKINLTKATHSKWIFIRSLCRFHNFLTNYGIVLKTYHHLKQLLASVSNYTRLSIISNS